MDAAITLINCNSDLWCWCPSVSMCDSRWSRTLRMLSSPLSGPLCISSSLYGWRNQGSESWTDTSNIVATERQGQNSTVDPCVPKAYILCPKNSSLLCGQCSSGRYLRSFTDSLSYWHGETGRAWSLWESRETWTGLCLHQRGSCRLCHLKWMDSAGWPLLLLGWKVNLRAQATWKQCVLWKERKYLILM